MGQDTWSKLGPSVSLELTVENLDLIKKLLQIEQLRCAITGTGDCDDEFVSFETMLESAEYYRSRPFDSREYDSRPLYAILTGEVEATNENVQALKKDGQPIFVNFLFVAYGVYARNISRRQNSHIFSQDEPWGFRHVPSINEVIAKLQEGTQIFLEAGVKAEDIKMGYEFVDW